MCSICMSYMYLYVVSYVFEENLDGIVFFFGRYTFHSPSVVHPPRTATTEEYAPKLASSANGGKEFFASHF